jgi:hypothetical protein
MSKSFVKHLIIPNIICILLFFFTACNKPAVVDNPISIIVEATVPEKLYSNNVFAVLDANKTKQNYIDRNLIFYWTCPVFPSGATAPSIKNASEPVAYVERLEIGQYRFLLKVQDDLGNTAESSFLMEVLKDTLIGKKLVADAGPDQLIEEYKLESFIKLTGSETINLNPIGRSLSFQWSVIQQPPGSNVTLEDYNSPLSYAFGIIGGLYQFRLEVKNETGEKAYDTVTVTIIPDLLKGTTRIFNDVLWEGVSDAFDYELRLKILDTSVFKGRLRHKLEVSIWDEQKMDWIDSAKYYQWIDDNGNLILSTFDESEILARINLIGKKTRLRVKFL